MEVIHWLAPAGREGAFYVSLCLELIRPTASVGDIKFICILFDVFLVHALYLQSHVVRRKFTKMLWHVLEPIH